MIERFHRTLKASLKARLTGSYWVEELPGVLLGLITAPKEDLGYSSAEMVYGEPLTIPGEMISNGTVQDFLPSVPLHAARPSFHKHLHHILPRTIFGNSKAGIYQARWHQRSFAKTSYRPLCCVNFWEQDISFGCVASTIYLDLIIKTGNCDTARGRVKRTNRMYIFVTSRSVS